MLQARAKVIQNKRVKFNYFHCILQAPAIAKSASPGQFVNIKVSDGLDPLLRRPLSIHKVGSHKSEVKSRIEILYEVVGKGTQILSQRKAGEYLDIVGPLGKGFNYQSLVASLQSPVLVAGGMGVAPLVFLAEKLMQVTRSPGHQVTSLVLIGAKTKAQILCEEEFRDLGYDVKIATDDGSRGFKGRVTDLLKSLLSTIDHRLSTIYACGPRPMLKEIINISKDQNIPAQVSLEEHMACGIGACLGCVVKAKDGHRRVCKDGPVFSAGVL